MFKPALSALCLLAAVVLLSHVTASPAFA